MITLNDKIMKVTQIVRAFDEVLQIVRWLKVQFHSCGAISCVRVCCVTVVHMSNHLFIHKLHRFPMNIEFARRSISFVCMYIS